MVVRIVKLTFQANKTQEFLDFFDGIKELVNEFPGCHGMQLMQQTDYPNVIFTYSKWDSEEQLNAYRNSETFGKVWPNIKPWFAAKPEAWTNELYFDGFR